MYVNQRSIDFNETKLRRLWPMLNSDGNRDADSESGAGDDSQMYCCAELMSSKSSRVVGTAWTLSHRTKL